MEAILRQFWPLLKPRVTALVAAQLIALAARGSVTLSKDEAVGLAALIVAYLEHLINTDDADPALVKTAAALARSAVASPEPVAVVPKKRKR